MRIVVCGGGTGGHVYPILAVVEALREQGLGQKDVLYAGTRASVEERLTGRLGLPFASIDGGQLRGKSPWAVAGGLWKTARGIRQALGMFRTFGPQVLLSTGGYASAPVLLAGRLAGVPSVIYLPDVEPGLTIQWLSRLAKQVAVSFDEVVRYFPAGKVIVTGYPVRSGLYGRDKEDARRRLHLESGRPVLLAFGGSQGARSINRAVASAAAGLVGRLQILHITGPLDYDWVCQQRLTLQPEQQARYHTYEYLDDEMLDALAAADLAVARAGAASLAELPAVGLPSILVPYPYSGQHQYANARFMEAHGASVVLEDSDLPARLADTVRSILTDEATRARMAEKARSLARPEAAKTLAAVVCQLAA